MTKWTHDKATEVSRKDSDKIKENVVDNDTNTNDNRVIPESVNYHFTRTCNYSCGFCFHTAKTSFNVPLETAKQGLEMLVKDGMKKVTLLF